MKRKPLNTIFRFYNIILKAHTKVLIFSGWQYHHFFLNPGISITISTWMWSCTNIFVPDFSHVKNRRKKVIYFGAKGSVYSVSSRWEQREWSILRPPGITNKRACRWGDDEKKWEQKIISSILTLHELVYLLGGFKKGRLYQKWWRSTICVSRLSVQSPVLVHINHVIHKNNVSNVWVSSAFRTPIIPHQFRSQPPPLP